MNRLYTSAYDIIHIVAKVLFALAKGCDNMSNKERAIQLINDVPDNKLVFVIDMLESLKAYAGEEIEPDEWDLQMIDQAEKENNGNTVTLDELERELGITV